MIPLRRARHWSFCIGSLALGLATPVFAANRTWTGASSTDFELPANWSGSTAPVNDLATDLAVFSGTVPANQPRLSASRGVTGLAFTTSTGGWSLGGNTTTRPVLTLGASGITTAGQSSGNTTVSADLALGAAQTWSAGTGGTLLVTGNVSCSTGLPLVINSTGNLGTVILSPAAGNSVSLTGGNSSAMFLQVRTGGLLVLGGDGVSAPATSSVNTIANNGAYGSLSITGNGSVRVHSGTWAFGDFGRNGSADFFSGSLDARGGVISFNGARYLGAGNLTVNGGTVRVTNTGSIYSNGGKFSLGSAGPLGNASLTLNSGLLDLAQANGSVGGGNSLGIGLSARAVQSGGVFQNGLTVGGGTNGGTSTSFNIGHTGLTSTGSGTTLTYTAVSNILASYTLSGGTFLSAGAVMGTAPASPGTNGSAATPPNVVVNPGTGNIRNFNFTGGTLAVGAYTAANLGYASATGLAGGPPHANPAANSVGLGTLFNHGGILAPGGEGTTGKTSLSGNYTVASANASFSVDLGGTTPATAFQHSSPSAFHDVLAVSGDTVLAGNLTVSLLAGYVPALGDSFTVLTSGGTLSGAFANVPFGGTLLASDGLTAFSVTQSGGSVLLTRIQLVAPSISASPVSLSVAAGSPAVFAVTASGTSMSYQWRKDGVAIPSATSAAFSIPAAQPADAALYDVVITNPAGSVTSAPARLAVSSPWSSPAAFIYNLNSAAPAANGSVPDSAAATTGTLIGTPSPAFVAGPNAASGNAWDFTGSNAFIRVASNPVVQSLGNITSTSGLSVGFWINYTWLSSAQNNLRVLGLANCIDVLTNDTHGDGILNFRFGNNVNIPQITLTTPRVLDGTWHHVVATLDFTRATANAKLYLDGALVVTQSQPFQASFTGGSSNFILGARNTSTSTANNPLRGSLDQFAVFTRALSAGEISQLFSAASVTNFAPSVTAAASAATVVSPAVQTTLVATASDDAQPAPASLTYAWSKVSGPGSVTFSSGSALVSDATFSALGSYVLRFTASDGALSSSADITVNVVANAAPVVFASTPTPLVGPSPSAITLDGAATDDGLPSASPLTFLWSQLSGPGSATFTNASAAKTSVSLPSGITGTYVFQLAATDGALSGNASVSVTVAANLAPSVQASSSLPAFSWSSGGANSTPVLATASDDGLPSSPGSLTYAWTLVNGPGSASFTNPAAAGTSVTVAAPGVYQLRVTTSDGALSTSSDLWLNAIASSAAVPVPTGIVARSATPPPYEHPRIFFTDSDHTALRAAALNDPVASVGRAALAANVAATLDNPATAFGAAFLQLKAGNTAFNTQALTVAQDSPGEAMIGGTGSGLYGLLSAASYLAWLDRDTSDSRLRELALATATAARNHATWWPADRAAQPTPTSFNRDTFSDLGFCYDLLYDWMSEDQRHAVRSLLAAQTAGRLTFGATEPDYSLSTNWRAYHDHIILASLAIEGETGHDAASLATNRQALKTFFTQWGVGPEGFNREGPGYFGFGTHSASLALYALSRRGEDLLATTRFYQSAQEMFYQMAPDGSGRMYGSNDGPGWGNGNGNTALYPILKAAYPADPFIDWVTRNALAPANSVIASSQPLIMAIWGRAPLEGNTSFAAAVAASPRPLHLFSPQRGFGVARSDWSDSALQVDFENRFDAFALGHSHAVRNHFTLFALGREWIGGHGYHYTANDLKSTVLIDGLGQSSASLQALAAAGKPAVISWPPLPGKFLENLDHPLLSVFAGDAKPAYTYSWSGQEYAYNPGDVPAGSIATPYRWKDLAYPGFTFPTPSTGDNSWADTFIRAEPTPFNPVERAFRSVLTVRGSRPYVLVLDDIQKDSTPRTYTWSANTVTNYNVIDMAVQPGATATEAVLYHTTTDTASGPRLLVRVLDAQGTAATPIALDNTALDFGEGPVAARRIQITRTQTVAPDFKILLYPHQSGEALPVTAYNRATGLLTITLPDGTADVFQLVLQPDGRTRVASFARNAATPPTLVTPSSVTVPIVAPATSAAVNFTLSATAANGTPLTPVANPPSGFVFPAGTTPVVVSVSDAAGNTSTATFNVTVGLLAPDSPTNLVVTPGFASNALAWSASAGAVTYNVKRATSPGGPYTVVASGLTATSYNDTGLVSGTSYYYVVSATNAVGESSASAESAAPPAPSTVLKANNTTALDQASSWTPAGIPGALDTVSWNGTYTNGIVSIGSGLTTARVQILAPSTSVTINTGTGPLSLGGGGIDMANATQSLSINAPVVLGAPQTWSLATGRVLNLNGVISDASAGHALTLAGSGSIVFAGNNTFTGPLALTGGTLHIGPSAGGLTGNLGAGNVTLSAGTLRYNRLDAQSPVAGLFTTTGGTLQVNYAAGTFTLNSTNLPAASVNTITSVAGASGATFIADAAPTASLTFGSSNAGLNIATRNGLVTFTSSSPASNLLIDGGSFTSSATDRFQLATANQTFSVTGGTVNLTAGTTFGFRVGGSGSATQPGAQNVTASQSGGNLTATTLNLGGNDTSSTKSPSYTLSGGSLTLTSNSSIALQIGADTAGLGSASFNLSGGTLRVPGTITGAQSGAKQVFAFTGGTLAAAAVNATRLRPDSASANGTLTQSGGFLAPGDAGTAGRTSITGNYLLGANATLALDLADTTQASAYQHASGRHDFVSVSGTTSLSGNLSVSLAPGFVPAGNSTFTVLSSTGALSGAFANVPFGERVLTSGDQGSFLVSQSGNTVTLSQYQVLGAPLFTASSSPASYAVGDAAVLGVTTSSLVPVTFSWTKNGTPIPGAASSALTFVNLTEADAGTYQVTASNAAGSVSQSFTIALTVPSSTAVTVIDSGTTQSFTASAAATSYQWFLDGDAVGTARVFSYSPTTKAVGPHWLRVVESYASGPAVTRTWAVRVRIPTPVSAIFYHVSPSGSDSNAGTFGAPFLTLEKARDTIRLLSAGQRAGGVTVYLRGGVHRRTTTFTLSSQDSGTASAPVVYAAYPGETPILTSTRVISSAQISPLAASEYARVAPGVSTSRIWEIDVTGNTRAAAFPNVFNEWTIFNAFRSTQNGGLFELFYQGERKKLSRYPNENATDDRLTPNLLMDGVAPGTSIVKNASGTYVTTAGSYLNFAGTYSHSDGSQRAVGGAFYYPVAEASRIARWTTAMNAGGLWVQGFWRVPWQINGAKVSFIDPTNRVIGFVTATNTNDPLVSGGIGDKYTRTANPTLGLGIGSKKEPWWVVNLLEEMDVPGEWAVDFARKKLYFLMGADGAPADSDIELSDVSVPLFQLNGASDVRLDGLSFRRHLGVNVQILNGARNLVRGCTFSQAGNMAVDINGGTDHGVISSDFEKLASGGVMLRGGSVTIPVGSTTPSSVTPSNHFTVNNRFLSFSEVVRVYQAAIDVGFGGPIGSWSVTPAVAGMRVANNYISTSPHAGILWHGYQHVIEYNELTDFTRISQDLGGIYRFGPNQDNNTVIRYNHLYASPLGEGIYNDFDHVRTPIYGNTINLKTPATAGRGYGIWTNTNTAAGGAVANIPTTLQVYNNVSVNSRSNYSLHSASGAPIQNNVSFRKLTADFAWYRISVNATTSTQTYSTSNATILSLQPATNIGYATDPGFIDFANDDLRLRPDSRVYTDMPAFVPLPLEMAGLHNDELRSASARVWTPFIVTAAASNVGSNTATFNASLVYPQFDPNATVRVYWGTTDGGTDTAAWQNVAILGQPGSGAVSHTRSDLAPATRYFYRFYAVNSAGEDWAEQSNSTTTFPLSAAPAGTATASSAATSPALAFDGLPATSWRTADGSTSGVITYQFSNDAAVLVTRYSVTSAADTPARDPRDWQLLGSYDGVTWVLLDTRSGQSFSARGQTLTYGFVSTSPYKFYRLNVTANNGDATALQLAELAFFTPNLTPDTSGPVITSPGNLTVAGIGSSGAVVNFDVSAVDAVSGNAAATASPPSGTLFPVGVTTVTVTASDAAGNQSTATFTITVTSPSIPAPWSIGQIQPFSGVTAGSVSVLTANSFQIAGTGGASTGGTTGDIWTGNNDSFTFFSQPWTGDGTFTARIASFTASDASAKAGIMFRETSTTGSRYSMTYFLRKGDAWAQHKTATSGSTTNTNFFTASSTGRGLPYWIRLVRTGDTFTNFISPDGVTWTQLGTARANPLSGTALSVGLAVGPRTGNTTATATFDNVSFISPLQAWRQTHFGTTSATGNAAPLADPDGDGVVNLLEYALGTTPVSAASATSPVLEITGSAPDPVLLALTFPRVADPVLTYRVEAATSLSPSDWTEIWQSTGSANIAGNVTVTDTSDLSLTPRRFLRLRVTAP